MSPRTTLGSIAVLLSAFLMSKQATAAPLWLERKFIPTPELVAPVFAQRAQRPATTVDHSAFDALLKRHVESNVGRLNRVRYSAFTPEDVNNLGRYVASLEAQDVTELTASQQMAFWINLYNASTIQLILDNYPVKTIRDIKVDGKGPWDHSRVTVNGNALTLSQIENHILRAAFDDPRIHYALNCASISCPNLVRKAYTAATLEADLDAAATAYVNDPRGVFIDKGRVTVSKIYGWYREDFGGTEENVLLHLRRYAEPALEEMLSEAKKITKYRYDWGLNSSPASNGR